MIRRSDQISAWDNEDAVAAVNATGRKNRTMPGVTVEVCLAYSKEIEHGIGSKDDRQYRGRNLKQHLKKERCYCVQRLRKK